ncbi:RHS repeat-associated core domain-containing protein [Actinophytocola glycyrrhizae]|uniref:RHS repeat-associated core domain-containing protein n=1 Tax=Actinophytocola glycyrrhizae TaxID=2044873 RepID=A0ABV9S5H0_9PSEU
MTSFERLRLPRTRAVGLTIALVATLLPPLTVATGVAAADGGPSVPPSTTPSVPVTAQTMQARPQDEASSDALDGDQDPSGVPAPPGSGTFTATSLSPSATWDVSGHTGDFSWSYPLRVPPAAGGLQPSLALSYRSSAVDGRTSVTNNQPSWIGDGWELSPGFIERTYGACAEDDEGSFTPPQVGDLCWRSDNATASFSGGGGILIRDDDTEQWRVMNDNGARVERLTGAANGDDNGEHWRITTLDGTQYLFGSQPSSSSTWTVPVFGDDADEPCHQAQFSSSHCVQGYRWNLDKVIDRHGNVIRYYYQTETNKYARNLIDTGVSYIRGGTLDRVEYGLRDDLPTAPATGRVVFTTADRCVKSSACTIDKPLNWPDTPLKDRCDTTTCEDHYSPTFWSTKRLNSVTTQVRRGTTYDDVDRWTFGHEFPDPGDGEKAALWLRSITHTGLAGDGELSLPAVTFEGTQMANRVHKQDGAGWLFRYRITGIVSESGGLTTIDYEEPQCKDGGPMPANPESNSLRCFPVRWAPDGGTERTDDYFHKYVVARIVQSDRLSTSTQQVTSYEYLDGAAWHWDTSEFTKEDKKTWNEFRGFKRVRVRAGSSTDPSGPITMTEQRFYRGMDGDKQPTGIRPASVTDSRNGTYTDHDWLQGFAYETTTFNGTGGPAIDTTITEPWWRGPTATRGPFKAYMVKPKVSRGYTRIEAANTWRETRTETTYNDDGLPLTVNDLGDTSTATDDRCTTTSYARNTTKWLLSFPAETETVSLRCGQTPQYPDDAIAAVRTSYDGQAAGVAPTLGNATRSEVADDYVNGEPLYTTIATSTYDDHGRVRDATDALGKTTTTAYTPAKGGPLTQTAVTTPPTIAVPAGLVTTTTLDTTSGQPVKITDPNRRNIEITYDALGRKTEVWLTNMRRSLYPDGNVKFSYLVRNDAPTVVTTKTIGSNGGNYVTTNELFDGLLRKRQIQAPAVDGGRLLTDIRYDSHGRVYKSTQPYYNDAAVDTTLWVASDVEIPGLSRSEYDGAGRPVKETFQAGATDKWHTAFAHDGDRVSVTPPTGGTPTTTITDARGQTVELRQFAASTPTGSYDKTTYGYTPSGQLAEVKDPAGNSWRYTYDLRGRQIRSEDPDKGATTYRYDNANQLESTTDARDLTLTNTYDALGRKTAVYEGDSDGTKLAEWNYDTTLLSKGHLASTTRWVNGNPYTTTVNTYSGGYQPMTVTLSIPQAEGALAGDYQWSRAYGPDGILSGESYAAGGGLDSETVNYVLDDWGRLLSSSGAHDGPVELVTDMLYTKYGETERVQLGDTGARRWLSFYYDDNTRRLTRSIVDAEVSQPMQTDVHYTYDPAGNITSIADTPAAQTADVQCFRYDHLRRLTDAWTPGTTSWDEDTGCSGDPTATGLQGPAPYWHSYTYDKTGNRLTETQHATTGDVERTYTYPATGQPRPHTLTSVTTDTPEGTTLDTFGYDATGNTTTRSLTGEDEVLRWDAEGHLASVTKDSQSSTFIYDTNGQRLIRKDPTSVTLYLGNQELKLDRATNTVSATRYYTAGGDGPTIAVRQGPTLTWLASDHQATHDIAIDSTTTEVTRRRQYPFGAPRGDQPTAWPGDRGFVGGTKDASTGLTHLGAREYDPTLGRFLSVDPIMDLTDPQQIHGYTYSNNNPITYSDPTGEKMQEDAGWIDSGSCKSGGHCGEPIDNEGPGTPDIHPQNRTTKHNNVQDAAVQRIRKQAKALGLKNFSISTGFKIDGASKKCADANWNQIADCGRYGFADIVLKVEKCAKPEQCYTQWYVWEVKAFGRGKGAKVAWDESEWYAAHLRDAENSVFADRGWDIGGPYKGEVAGYPNTSYWGGMEGAVVYGDEDKRPVRNHLNQQQGNGSLAKFHADDDRWAKWRQPAPPPSVPNVRDKPPAPGMPIPPPIVILPRLPVPLR